jgi:hypothetical protein
MFADIGKDHTAVVFGGFYGGKPPVFELLDSSIAVTVTKSRTIKVYPFGHAFIQDLSRIFLGS